MRIDDLHGLLVSTGRFDDGTYPPPGPSAKTFVVWTRHDQAMTVSPDDGIRNAYLWFEVNSGWAPPDRDTLDEWFADGVCRCPDDCLVVPEGCCEHGLASWWVILTALDAEAES
jgi:hypothetical protein